MGRQERRAAAHERHGTKDSGKARRGMRSFEERREDKLAGWQRKTEEGRMLSTKKTARLGQAKAARQIAELEKPTTTADYAEAHEEALAQTGAEAQAGLQGQPMGLPGQMAGKVVQRVRQMQEGLRGDVLKRAVSEMDLREQIRERKLAATKAEMMQYIAMKKAGRKAAASLLAGATTSA